MKQNCGRKKQLLQYLIMSASSPPSAKICNYFHFLTSKARRGRATTTARAVAIMRADAF